MRFTDAVSLAATLVPLTDALQLVQRETPQVIRADIQRRDVNLVQHDRMRFRKRQDSQTLQETLDNLQTLYFANASLGTPAQNLRLHIDTGSSDLWANAPNSTFCRDAQNGCDEAGTYNLEDSSTYQYVNEDFNISYVDGSGAAGIYAKDTLNFGNVDIEALQFGIGFTSSSAEGILGIGYAANEVQVNRANGETYPNLPQALVDKGTIQTNAYSLWLNDLDASMGSILFGGVDTRKYSGQLSTLPILSEQGGVYAEFIIAMTALGRNGEQGSIFKDQNEPVLLDSGSSLVYLPDNVVESLYKTYSAQYDQDQGAAFIDCNTANSQDSLEFGFSGVTISVPMNELVLEAGTNRRGELVCYFGIAPNGGSTSVLGDTFLRSAYVVYDLQNNEISLAQTAFNSTESNVMEITKDQGVPDATGVPGAVATAPVELGTGGAHNGGPNPTGTDEGAAPRQTAIPWLGAAVAGLGFLAVL